MRENKISYQVKFKKDQTFNFIKNKYGLFSKDGKRSFVKNGIIKITINCHNEIYYQDLNTKLYADTNWKNKKVTFPSLRQLKELHLVLLSEDFKTSKSKLLAFEKKLNKIIQYLTKKIKCLIQMKYRDQNSVSLTRKIKYFYKIYKNSKYIRSLYKKS